MKRKPMGMRNSKKYFKKTAQPKKVNYQGANLVQRGGIRL